MWDARRLSAASGVDGGAVGGVTADQRTMRAGFAPTAAQQLVTIQSNLV